MNASANAQWPDLPFAAWHESCDTLLLWMQIVGKVRIACTPLISHWWNATFDVTSRGLLAPAMPYRGRSFDVVFDFTRHQLAIEASDGRAETLALEPMSVADFYAAFMQALHRLDIDVHIWTTPSEIEGAIAFEQDRTHAQYDRVYVQKFWQALVQAHRVFTAFRARFIGKASPVHFFWGGLDLADMTVETPQLVADRIRAALPYVKADRLVVAPDCGMKYLPRAVAFAKMKAMADGAALMRGQLGGA